MKPLIFLGNSKYILREFPVNPRHRAGLELLKVQFGSTPSDFKPMPSIGKGAYEIRLHLSGEWRVIYVARRAEAVYVLHAFEKKTQKTPKADIDLAARRYKVIGD